jgi:hypothetical protein
MKAKYSRWVLLFALSFTFIASFCVRHRIVRAEGEADGWYGFANETSPQDQEQALVNHWGPFNRVVVPFTADHYPVTFAALCQNLHKTCTKVGDFQGNLKGCYEISQKDEHGYQKRDGSRIAYCVAQK